MWIVRERQTKTLYASNKIPKRLKDFWGFFDINVQITVLNKDLFPEITPESEPVWKRMILEEWLETKL